MKKKFTPGEKEKIDAAFQEMLTTYRGGKEGKVFITKAFELAYKAHGTTRRKSGEPYIFHPIAVARISSEEFGFGRVGLAAALLHDVVEDTDYTVEDIRRLFGDGVATIIFGLTKIPSSVSKMPQPENFQKLIAGIASDIRVILIKFADRLHNLRTLEAMPPDKQLRIVGETKLFYIPLAYRLGVFNIRSEMEDLCFQYEHPAEYRRVWQQTHEKKAGVEKTMREFIAPVKEELDKQGYKYKYFYRAKSLFSIYEKMKKKGLSHLNEVYDLFAGRIIFSEYPDKTEETACYAIYQLIAAHYPEDTTRKRDWIMQSRASGYKALHGTFRTPLGEHVEIQIRSEAMHELAEKGMAAHYHYKQVNMSAASAELEKFLLDINDFLSRRSHDIEESFKEFSLNLYDDEINVFTPKGDLIRLPKNATVIDFAYEVHTEIGNHCIGAKINNRLLSPTYVLQNGQQVEVLTSEKQIPQLSWLNRVITTRARSRIRAYHRTAPKELIKEGRKVFRKSLKRLGLRPKKSFVQKVQRYLGESSMEMMYQNIGMGKHTVNSVEATIKRIRSRNRSTLETLSAFMRRGSNRSAKKTGDFFDAVRFSSPQSHEGEEVSFQLATCCRPIPGERILGIQQGDTIFIHRVECSKALELRGVASHKVKTVSLEWKKNSDFIFLAFLHVRGKNRRGLLYDLTGVISHEMNINIQSFSMTSSRNEVEGILCVHVPHISDLNSLEEKLRQVKGIKYITRTNNE